jgi:collagenase-like PrtC family protease
MRNLVQPLPSMRCERCAGELRFKRIESADPVFDTEIEIFVCVDCGRTHSRRMIHDRYAAHTARSMPHGNVDRPDAVGGNRHA